MADGNQLNGDPAQMSHIANQLQPTNTDAGSREADAITAGATPCSKPTPGCGQFLAAQRETAEKFKQFFAQANQGLASYRAITHASANGYTTADGRGKEALMQALQDHPASLAGAAGSARDGANNLIETALGTPTSDLMASNGPVSIPGLLPSTN